MGIIDLLAAGSLDVPGASSRGRDPRENLVAATSVVGFPVLDFAVVLFADLYNRPTLALIVLPAAFTAACVVSGRLLRVSAGWALRTALGCAVLCLFASTAALLLGLFASFYSGF